MLQKEHAEYFKVRAQLISMDLQRLGITRKKAPYYKKPSRFSGQISKEKSPRI
jgi:hypothetical protein